MTPPDPIDCLVIGAGPAGLATSIYLARFRRRFEVFDDGNSRAAWIPVSHNLTGFTNGISGKNLLSRMRSHAKKYGATITQGSVVKLARDTGGLFVATASDGRVIRASMVMLATGVIDEEPALPQLRQAVRRGLIRHCGICDGYEVIDKKVGVIGYGRTGLGEALFLRNYSSDITLLSLGRPLDLPPEDHLRMQEAGIKSIEAAVEEVAVEGKRIAALRIQGGETHAFDSLYSALGSTARTGLLHGLGAALDERQCVIVDNHQRSSVDGLFVAGDVASGLDQIAIAMGQAAIAATAIHNRLRGAHLTGPAASVLA